MGRWHDMPLWMKVLSILLFIMTIIVVIAADLKGRKRQQPKEREDQGEKEEK